MNEYITINSEQCILFLLWLEKRMKELDMKVITLNEIKSIRKLLNEQRLKDIQFQPKVNHQ